MIQLQFPPINSGMDALDSKRPALGNEYLNEDISIDHFIVKNYTGTGIYVRGKNLSIIDGCSFSGLGKRTFYINGANAELASLQLEISDKSGCPSYENIGAQF